MTNNIKTEVATKTKTNATELDMHFKDNPTINHRSAQDENFEKLLNAINGNDLKCFLIKGEPDKNKPHIPDHSKCDYSKTDSERITEKRICRCFYYYNSDKITDECATCPFAFKKKNIGDFKITDYEVPSEFVIEGIGGIDWLLNDNGKLLATEVKPPKSSETLVRMVAEALTYTIGTNYTPAICFFLKNKYGNDTKQMVDYRNYRNTPAFRKIIDKKHLRVLGIEINNDTFKIIDLEKNFSEDKLIDYYPDDDIYNAFDMAIKKLSVTDAELNTGYVINGIRYMAYSENSAWDDFVNAMKPEHRKQFGDGAGGELKPKDNKPPKMASYASSSRMLYTLAKDIPDFQFEKQLPFVVEDTNTTAYLDGFLKTQNKYYFIEAKCRELYQHKPVFEVSKKYTDLYKYINENATDLNCNIVNGKCKDGYMKVKFTSANSPIEHFDIKQMICHLAGIATAVLNGEYNDSPIAFEYLIYKPNSLKLSEPEGTKIRDIYSQTLNEANSIDFKKLFRIILDFISQTTNTPSPANKDWIVDNFMFDVCAQE